MRLAADAAHQFGGIDLDRSKPLSFKLDGIRIDGFAGDTVLSAVLAAGIDTYGTYGGVPMALTDRFGPLVASKRGAPLPMDRLPALDGVDLTSVGERGRLSVRQPHSLRHILDRLDEPGWLRAAPDATLSADLLVVGGGVTGLAAAQSAAMAGRTVIVAERRPWFGGDARYFGPVGDEDTPELVTARLLDWLATNTNVTLLGRTEAFGLQGPRAMLHQIEMVEGAARGRVVAVAASRVLLATGATQRLPVFPGNRLPGVLPAIFAYHLAKRYGVAQGDSAVVATQGNTGYRLALRLSDAGVAIRRVVDTRINAQSRFIDFAKAGGLTLASGQIPLAAQSGRFTFAPTTGTGASVNVDASHLVVAGGWQPDLTLWMQTGGSVHWSNERAALIATGQIDHIGLAGSAVGYRSMKACIASGRAAQAAVFGDSMTDVEDAETGTALETPDAPTPMSAHASDLPSFLDAGRSLAVRPSAVPSRKALPRSQAISLADAAASVELQLIAPGDAGAIAEERGAPGSRSRCLGLATERHRAERRTAGLPRQALRRRSAAGSPRRR